MSLSGCVLELAVSILNPSFALGCRSALLARSVAAPGALLGNDIGKHLASSAVFSTIHWFHVAQPPQLASRRAIDCSLFLFWRLCSAVAFEHCGREIEKTQPEWHAVERLLASLVGCAVPKEYRVKPSLASKSCPYQSKMLLSCGYAKPVMLTMFLAPLGDGFGVSRVGCGEAERHRALLWRARGQHLRVFAKGIFW